MMMMMMGRCNLSFNCRKAWGKVEKRGAETAAAASLTWEEERIWTSFFHIWTWCLLPFEEWVELLQNEWLLLLMMFLSLDSIHFLVQPLTPAFTVQHHHHLLLLMIPWFWHITTAGEEKEFIFSIHSPLIQYFRFLLIHPLFMIWWYDDHRYTFSCKGISSTSIKLIHHHRHHHQRILQREYQ